MLAPIDPPAPIKEDKSAIFMSLLEVSMNKAIDETAVVQAKILINFFILSECRFLFSSVTKLFSLVIMSYLLFFFILMDSFVVMSVVC